MCTLISDLNPSGSKRQHVKNHQCLFKILRCSHQQLCILCFLLYYFAMGNSAAAQNATMAPPASAGPHSGDVPTSSPLEGVQCSGDVCYWKIPSSKEALEKMASVSKHLYESYSTRSDSKKYVGTKGIENFFKDVGLIKEEHEGDDHEGHDHEGHNHDHGAHDDHDHGAHDDHDHGAHDDHDHGAHDDHDHAGHDHAGHDHEELNPDDWTEELADYFPDFMNPNYEDPKPGKKEEFQVQCISSVDELVKSYFNPNMSETVQLNFGDFVTLLPQILLNMKICNKESEAHDHNHGDHGHDHGDHDHNHGGESKISVEQSPRNIWLISFGSVLLISLVSLLGVMLIPLIRHTKLLNQIISFLVALAVGTLAGDALLHLLPHATGAHDHGAHGGHDHGGHDHGEEEDDHFASMWKGLVACLGIYVFFVLETVMSILRKKKANKKLHRHSHKDHICEVPSQSAATQSNQQTKDSIMNSFSGSPLLQQGDKCTTPTDEKKGHVLVIDEEVIGTGHTHHHPHEVPKTIANLAWMVIMGDGLHNLTDGLAIGVAFTSSIGIGLGTSLAIFCHEIPQELGDFAILLNSGMSVKQALLGNFLSACLCFVGLAIGLLLGEHTSGIILWILAFTAGGFLYISLVDMLPAMIKQLEHKDYKRRFLVQNIGILAGFGVMVIIALKEESFTQYF